MSFAAYALLVTAPAAAGQAVQYPSGTTNIDGLPGTPVGGPPLARGLRPSSSIHDDQGLTDAVRATARLFAAEGFVALAPDLVSRLAGSAATGAGRGEVAARPRLHRSR